MQKYKIKKNTRFIRYKSKAVDLLQSNKKTSFHKAPFIRSFGYISCGLIFFILLIVILSLPSYENIADYLGAAIMIVILGGLGSLCIINAIRMRRW